MLDHQAMNLITIIYLRFARAMRGSLEENKAVILIKEIKYQVLHIDPQRQGDINTISYSSDGFIDSSNAEFKKDLDYVLNLNAKEGYLISNRKTALSAFKHRISMKIGQRIATNEDWRKFAKAIKDDNGRYIPYAGIVLWYINRKLGKTCK